MQRDDHATLKALGFDDEELARLGLWDVPTGTPGDLADAYIRRSNKRDDVTTLRAHVRDVVRTAAIEGKTIRHIWFEQRSASKAYVKREEFDHAIAAILDGLSRTLYIWKTDRISRRGMGHVGHLLDEFDKRGARLVSVTEGLDSSKGSRMVFAILSERARDEAKDIALRVKTGGDAHKAEGRYPGGGVPYGLRRVDGKLVRVPTEYPTARRIADYLLKSKTPAWIAATLNAEGKRTRLGKLWTAQAIIGLPHAAGWAGLVPNREARTDEFGASKGTYFKGGDPLIGSDGHPVTCGDGVITFAEREKILSLFRARSAPGTAIGNKTRGKRQMAAPLAGGGLFLCGLCGGPMENGGSNYRCKGFYASGRTACPGGGVCTLRVRVDECIEMLWRNHLLIVGPESSTVQDIARRWLNYEDPAKTARKAAVSAALDNAGSRELRLQKEFFIGKGMDERVYDALRAELSGQIASLKAELAELSKDVDLSPMMDGRWLTALWESEGPEGRNALLKAAIRSVTLIPPRYKGDKTPIAQRLAVEWLDTTSEGPDIGAALAYVDRVRERRAAARTGA